jgi:hypothetical protein
MTLHRRAPPMNGCSHQLLGPQGPHYSLWRNAITRGYEHTKHGAVESKIIIPIERLAARGEFDAINFMKILCADPFLHRKCPIRRVFVFRFQLGFDLQC